jgi:hypothetical protein
MGRYIPLPKGRMPEERTGSEDSGASGKGRIRLKFFLLGGCVSPENASARSSSGISNKGGVYGKPGGAERAEDMRRAPPGLPVPTERVGLGRVVVRALVSHTRGLISGRFNEARDGLLQTVPC